MTIWFLAYLLCGAISGFFAGLLGIGGGIMLVPMLLFVFDGQGFQSDAMMRMALATSMAAIVFTSLSSFRAHNKLGNVCWDFVRHAVIGVLFGAVAGALTIRFIDTILLTAVFVFFVFYIATNMMIAMTPKPSRQLPGPFGQGVFGLVVGFLSFLLSAGGGFLTVPFLSWCNVSIRKAIGTSAALGFPIALFGAIGYMINGLGAPGRPDYCLGYIYLPGFLGVIMTSVLVAPLGARLSQNIPVKPLKRIFALLLYAVAAKMLYNLID